MQILGKAQRQLLKAVISSFCLPIKNILNDATIGQLLIGWNRVILPINVGPTGIVDNQKFTEIG